MMQQGMGPDSCDYDGRTALMLAAGHGHLDAVQLLLSAGADPSKKDSMQVGGMGSRAVGLPWGICCCIPQSPPTLQSTSHHQPQSVTTNLTQGCALLEAARAGHDGAIDALLAAGAHISMSQVASAAHLCTAVFEGDVPLLRRLLRAGMDPDAGDYDGRRAAHIAAAESALPAVSFRGEGGRGRGM